MYHRDEYLSYRESSSIVDKVSSATNIMAFSVLEPTRHDVYSFIDPANNLNGGALNKVVLVTGAGGGIGRGIAEAFALAGAKQLVLVGRRREPLEVTANAITASVRDCQITMVDDMHVEDTDSVNSLFTTLQDILDVLINNAAVSSSVTAVTDSYPEEMGQY